MRLVSLREYVNAVLETAEYQPCEELGCVVAVARALPGCITQGRNYEEARTLLIDAVETWILSAVRDGEVLPEVNGCQLAVGVPVRQTETDTALAEGKAHAEDPAL
ncbi:MAG: type II toxin-antitoxin system HicB family antitoxin [Thermodesulforhabdaceae bacterium]